MQGALHVHEGLAAFPPVSAAHEFLCAGSGVGAERSTRFEVTPIWSEHSSHFSFELKLFKRDRHWRDDVEATLDCNCTRWPT